MTLPLANIPEPWNAARATERIRAMSASPAFTINLRLHAEDQMADRDLTMSDVLYVLKKGFIYKDAEPGTRAGLFKYEIEYTTPNSNGRSVRLVVIPSMTSQWLKVLTVMWVDEPRIKG